LDAFFFLRLPPPAPGWARPTPTFGYRLRPGTFGGLAFSLSVFLLTVCFHFFLWGSVGTSVFSCRDPPSQAGEKMGLFFPHVFVGRGFCQPIPRKECSQRHPPTPSFHIFSETFMPITLQQQPPFHHFKHGVGFSSPNFCASACFRHPCTKFLVGRVLKVPPYMLSPVEVQPSGSLVEELLNTSVVAFSSFISSVPWLRGFPNFPCIRAR